MAQLTLTWSDNSNNETGFSIERSDDGLTGWIEIDTVAADDDDYVDTGLDDLTTYYYRVRAFNATKYSAYSNIASAATGPPTANQHVWVYADQIVGLVDGNSVLTWEDQSPENNDATAGGGNRPVYKTNIQNGLPVVRGTFDNYLSFLTLDEAADSWTAYIVMNPTDVTNTDGHILRDQNTGNFQLFNSENIAGPRSVGYRAQDGDHSIAVATTGWQIVSWHLNKNTTVGEVFRDGVSLGTSAVPAAGIALVTPTFMNAAPNNAQGPFVGDIGEFLLYKGTHTTGERQAIEGYLNGKWDIF